MVTPTSSEPAAEMAGEDSLESLMERYSAGDPGAFDELHARTAARVHSYFRWLTRDRSRADDLTQCTYLKLHRARRGWLTGAAVMPWLMTIARNTFLDDARARSRTRVWLTDSGELPDQPDTTPSVVLASELRRAIDLALDQLVPRQKEAFMLTKHVGLSPREAAAMLGTTEMAVKLRVHRARLALRSRLASYRAVAAPAPASA